MVDVVVMCRYVDMVMMMGGWGAEDVVTDLPVVYFKPDPTQK